jgi:hypothetical protein
MAFRQFEASRGRRERAEVPRDGTGADLLCVDVQPVEWDQSTVERFCAL